MDLMTKLILVTIVLTLSGKPFKLWDAKLFDRGPSAREPWACYLVHVTWTQPQATNSSYVYVLWKRTHEGCQNLIAWTRTTTIGKTRRAGNIHDGQSSRAAHDYFFRFRRYSHVSIWCSTATLVAEI